MAGAPNITRRDFLSGTALSLAAGTSLSPLELLAAQGADSGYYPPALSGLRGSHTGSFEIAHAVAWQGAKFGRPGKTADDDYDLVVVGGGVSGLTAAFLWQQQHGGSRKVLVLDNHDDFGGHAKRNEFEVDGKTLLGYGGSEALENPGQYSRVAKKLLVDLGIDVEAFYDYFDFDLVENSTLRPGVHFNKAVYGRDVTAIDAFSPFAEFEHDVAMGAIDSYPLSEKSKADMRRLFDDEEDHLAGFDIDEKIRILLKTPYTEFLTRYVGVTEEVADYMRDLNPDEERAGYDAVSAEVAWWAELPGTWGIDLGDYREDEVFEEEPYIFNFPDGNATIARALVQKLVPRSVGARNVEELVTASLDYAELDRRDNMTRIRLNATAVDVRHTPDQDAVEVVYVRNGRPELVRGKRVVLACNNAVIPYICADMDAAQREALKFASRSPIVYTNIVMRHSRHHAELGLWGVYVPNAPLANAFYLSMPINVGEYRTNTDYGQPTMLRALCAMRTPGQGMTEREQHIAGRKRLLEMSFDDHERLLLQQLDGAFCAAGLDVERDIAAITVNRWPHGYAYYYNSLFDPPEYNHESGPHLIGRARIGRITIANMDSHARSYIDAAIDAAHRAVTEQSDV